MTIYTHYQMPGRWRWWLLSWRLSWGGGGVPEYSSLLFWATISLFYHFILWDSTVSASLSVLYSTSLPLGSPFDASLSHYRYTIAFWATLRPYACTPALGAGRACLHFHCLLVEGGSYWDSTGCSASLPARYYTLWRLAYKFTNRLGGYLEYCFSGILYGEGYSPGGCTLLSLRHFCIRLCSALHCISLCTLPMTLVLGGYCTWEEEEISLCSTTILSPAAYSPAYHLHSEGLCVEDSWKGPGIWEGLL